MQNNTNFPEFSEDIIILLKNSFSMKPDAIKSFENSLKEEGLTISIKNYKNKFDTFERSFNNYACINMFINKNLNKLNDNLLRQFIFKCEPVFLSFASLSAASSINQLIVFTDILKKKLRFDFDFVGDYKIALQKVFSTIESFKKLNIEELENKIEKHFNPSDPYIHLSYLSNDWQVIDPLVSRIREKSSEYMEGKDFRINKPSVILNENSHSELFTFENKWTLHFDKFHTNMFKPNDVSLYSNISDKNLMEAKELYKKIINSNNFFLDEYHPHNNTQKIYFDYFEKIIQSIIAAFTSIEALLNLCFEYNEVYEWKRTDKKKSSLTEYKGAEIEQFSFKEKIKFITIKILLKSQKEFDKLYSVVEKLKNLRDEIIHAKPSKSEDRYSNFLDANIFNIIDSHKEFIKVMGTYISENAKYLLNEFPYTFGQDEFFPSLFTDEESIQLFNEIYRPSANIKPSNKK